MATSIARPGLPNPKSVIAEIRFGGATTEAAGGVEAPFFRILRTDEVDAYETKPSIAEAMLPEGRKKKAPGEQFGGTSRKAAKLSIADAAIEKFTDVAALISTLTANAIMKKKMKKPNPTITTDAKSNRVAEEKRNVRVDTFIYAASVEDDNDYHLILGRDPNASGKPVYMTMELSGLPPANFKSHKALKAARDAFKKFFAQHFNNELPGKKYDFYDPPIRVQIEGSLFWDASHPNGGPGPQSLRPNMPVVWEVHPISKMKLFPPG